MNILFLDYDGVVNTAMWDKEGKHCRFSFPSDNKVNNFQACQWVSEFCQKYNYKIVATSTWRLHDNYKECLINGGLREGIEIIDKTPDLRYIHDHSCRGEEIREWLIKHHSEVDNFIIVDDEGLGCNTEGEEYYLDHLVLCNMNHGFGISELIKAEKMHEKFEREKE